MNNYKSYLQITGLLFLSLVSIGQDTLYLDRNMDTVLTKTNAAYYRLLTINKDSTVIERDYYISDQIWSEISYSQYIDKKILDGRNKYWRENGKLKVDIGHKNNKLHGKIMTYWENGKVKRDDNYLDGEFIDGKCFNENGEEIAHFDYQIKPAFTGGDAALFQYLSTSIRYPKKARRKGIQGKVILNFVVNKDGSISDVILVRSVHELLDNEAMRVVKAMPDWTPGKNDGDLVKVKYTLPVTFKFED